MVDSGLKEIRDHHDRKHDDDSDPDKDKSTKRGREDSSEGDSGSGSAKESYAEVAGDEPWLEPRYNKKKKKAKVDNSMMELLRSKSEPTKEIFILSLDYSRCRRNGEVFL